MCYVALILCLLLLPSYAQPDTISTCYPGQTGKVFTSIVNYYVSQCFREHMYCVCIVCGAVS